MQLSRLGGAFSVLGDVLRLQATWRPTSWICNRVTGVFAGACVAERAIIFRRTSVGY